MVFDTGAAVGTFRLDSGFCAAHPIIKKNRKPDAIAPGGCAWSMTLNRTLGYYITHSTRVGMSILEYNSLSISNYKRYFNSYDSDGLFSIPKNDTTNVWELNFEQNYLEIHPAVNFKMPKDCFVVPMVKDENNPYPFNIKLPIKVTCGDGDTVTLSRTYLIDTGASHDICLMGNAQEFDFFNNRDDAVWTTYLNGYFKHCEVDAQLFDTYHLDSLRIYTYNNPNRITLKYLIGLNFFKRFNVFFDTKRQEIGLQPIKTFQRIVNPNYRRFHFSADKTSQGKIVIREVGDYKENYFKTVGLHEGDEIVNVNNKPIKSISHEEKLKFHMQDTLVFDIIRIGKPLKLIVPVDKTEQQGD